MQWKLRRALLALATITRRVALMGVRPVMGGENQGGGPAGGSTPPGQGSSGGQGGSGETAGGGQGESSAGAGGGGSGGQGGSGSGQGGGNAEAAAQRLLRKREQELEEARQRLQELEDAGKSEVERERAKRERAERERDDARRAATVEQRRGLVRSVAGELKLNAELVAELATSKLAELDDDRDAAKALVEGIRDRYQLPAAESGGQPATFGTPAAGGGSGGQGSGGQGGASQQGGVSLEGAKGDAKQDYRGGIGRGILAIARARGAVGPPNNETE